MFVKNAKLLLKQGMTADGTTSVTGTASDGTTATIEVYSTSISRFLALGVAINNAYYNTMYCISNGTNVFYGNSSYGSSHYGIKLGDSDIPVSADDYNLKGNLITTFTASTSVSSVVNADGSVTFTALYNITNTGADAFTIKEIGNFRRNQYGGSASIMVSRDVLESPLTIPAGETKILRYSVTI